VLNREIRVLAEGIFWNGMNQIQTPNQENRFLFALFCAWTFVLLCRPQDYFTFLVPVRPALFLGLFTFLVFFVTMPVSSHVMLFKNNQVKLYMALICIMVLSIPLALYRRAAFEFVFLGYINVILFFFIFLAVVNTPEKVKTILFVGCLGTGLYLIIALIKGGIVAKRLYFGNMFDPNDLAFFSLSFLPFNLIFVSEGNPLVKRLVCISNFVIGALVILLTGSRGGFIGFSIVLLMLFLTKTNTFRASYKVVFAVLVLVFVSTNMRIIDFNRYESIINLEDDYNKTSETGRLEIWKVGVRVMLSHPFTGVGLGCFAEAIGTDRDERGLIPRWQAAHNSLIQIGSESGVIGAILFVLASLNAFRIFGQARRRSKSDGPIKIAEMARIGFVGHFISAMFVSQAYSIYWAFYIALSAIADRLIKQEAEGALSPFEKGNGCLDVFGGDKAG